MKNPNVVSQVIWPPHEQVYFIQLPAPHSFNTWQPWLKGYHGEVALGGHTYPNWMMYAWLDQDLKEEMTGRR